VKNLKSDIFRCTRNWVFWASKLGLIYQGGLYNMTASVNVLTETVALGKPPRCVWLSTSVIDFARQLTVTASVNKKWSSRLMSGIN
jgi:hypothetical protein